VSEKKLQREVVPNGGVKTENNR